MVLTSAKEASKAGNKQEKQKVKLQVETNQSKFSWATVDNDRSLRES